MTLKNKCPSLYSNSRSLALMQKFPHTTLLLNLNEICMFWQSCPDSNSESLHNSLNLKAHLAFLESLGHRECENHMKRFGFKLFAKQCHPIFPLLIVTTRLTRMRVNGSQNNKNTVSAREKSHKSKRIPSYGSVMSRETARQPFFFSFMNTFWSNKPRIHPDL